MNLGSCDTRYIMYPLIASDTLCVGDSSDTMRIICHMNGDTWRQRTKAKMQALAVTQDDLKDVFDVTTRGAVGHYLSGRRTPSPEQLIALGRRLSMSMDELLLGAPASQPPRLNTERLSALIEAILIPVSKKDVPIKTVAGMTARMAVSLYEQGVAAAAVQSILPSLLRSMEEPA
jgi:transcriptional regulator with XRE-family HTH domain